MWVLYSKRPLREKELRHAVMVDVGVTDIGSESIYRTHEFLRFSLGLLTVEPSSSAVRFVHFTLKEHLSDDPLSGDPLLPDRPHSLIAEVCLKYLNIGYVKDLSPTLNSAPSTMPLLEYASVYWGEHARGEMTEEAKILSLKLLDRFDKHISAQLLLRCNNGCTGPASLLSQAAGGPIGFTGLHGAAFLGISEIVTPLLEMRECDVNATDCMGSTALIWAVRTGQEEVVKVLLDRVDVDPDRADQEYDRTPLMWAIITGHEGVVKMLLKRGHVNPNKADSEYGRTPLMWAIIAGHEWVVKILLGRKDIDPGYANPESGVTPLLLAVVNGCGGIVKMLLERQNVSPDRVDTEYGRTPLMWAIITGSEGIVKMLLERKDVNPDYAHPECGVTPLLLAAVSAHGGIVKMLLEREDVDPDRADTEYGQTPLSRAAAWGHEEVVKMLLEREDVNPRRADTKDGRTPLVWAARNGHEGVVKMLLQRNDG